MIVAVKILPSVVGGILALVSDERVRVMKTMESVVLQEKKDLEHGTVAWVL